MIFGLRRGRQRGQRPSVEGVDGGEDDGLGDSAIAGVAARALDGSLVGFGTAVAEEDLVGHTIVAEPLCQFCLRRNVIQVADVMNLIHLIDDGLGESWMRMA